MSQSELARRAGIPQQRIAYVERRARSVSVDIIVKLASALGVAVDDLAGVQPPPTKRRPGPRSQLDDRVERIRKLSRRDQAQVIEVIDALLLKHGG